MNVPRAVVDTNILVSALIRPEGPPGLVIDDIRNGQLVPVVTADILEEYDEVLHRPKLRLGADEVSALLALLRDLGEWVELPNEESLSGKAIDGVAEGLVPPLFKAVCVSVPEFIKMLLRAWQPSAVVFTGEENDSAACLVIAKQGHGRADWTGSCLCRSGLTASGWSTRTGRRGRG